MSLFPFFHAMFGHSNTLPSSGDPESLRIRFFAIDADVDEIVRDIQDMVFRV